MPDEDKIKRRIAEIAGRIKNVRLGEIHWVIEQLGQSGHTVRFRKYGDHGTMFTVGTHQFGICTHNRGASQLKPYYVNQFLKVMIELGLYDD